MCAWLAIVSYVAGSILGIFWVFGSFPEMDAFDKTIACSVLTAFSMIPMMVVFSNGMRIASVEYRLFWRGRSGRQEAYAVKRFESDYPKEKVAWTRIVIRPKRDYLVTNYYGRQYPSFTLTY